MTNFRDSIQQMRYRSHTFWSPKRF